MTRRRLEIVVLTLIFGLSQLRNSAHDHAYVGQNKQANLSNSLPSKAKADIANQHYFGSSAHQTYYGQLSDKRPVRGCYFSFVDPNRPNPNSKFRTKDRPTPPQPQKPRYRGSKNPSSGGKITLSPQHTRSLWRLWGETLGAVVVICVVPVMWLTFMPDIPSPEHSLRMKVGLAFASSCLLGDAFLHLIPHSIFSESHTEGTNAHGHSHGSEEVDYFTVCLKLFLVVCGIFSFFAIEQFMLFGLGPHRHGHGDVQDHYPAHNQSHDQGFVAGHVGAVNVPEMRQRPGNKDGERDNIENAGGDSSKSLIPIRQALLPAAPSFEPPAQPIQPVEEGVEVAGYLNVVADLIHTFIDGLFIGTSFLASERAGLITTSVVLCHEIPHAIGDYAILTNSGYSKPEAIKLQLKTSLRGSVVGALFSLVAGMLTDGVGHLATVWIMPFAAGGFIYIALVSVYPELVKSDSWWQILLEFVAMICGVGLMIMVAYME